MADKMENLMAELERLNDLTRDMDDFSDPLADMDMEEFAAGFGDMMNPFGLDPTMGRGPKEIGLYDTVIVHGMKGTYQLTFEETEEGLVINVK